MDVSEILDCLVHECVQWLFDIHMEIDGVREFVGCDDDLKRLCCVGTEMFGLYLNCITDGIVDYVTYQFALNLLY